MEQQVTMTGELKPKLAGGYAFGLIESKKIKDIPLFIPLKNKPNIIRRFFVWVAFGAVWLNNKDVEQ